MLSCYSYLWAALAESSVGGEVPPPAAETEGCCLHFLWLLRNKTKGVWLSQAQVREQWCIPEDRGAYYCWYQSLLQALLFSCLPEFIMPGFCMNTDDYLKMLSVSW